jgi:signal transduction histidine kinase
MAQPANPPRGGLLVVAGVAALTLSAMLALRAGGLWLGDALTWPAALAVVGALLIWRESSSGRTAGRRRAWAAHAPPRRAKAAALRKLSRPELSVTGLGVALVLGAGLAFLWANGALRPAGDVLLAAFVVLLAATLVFAPSWRRLARGLAAERAERIRSQERADLGAHLHDSVLQTLALVQRNAADPGKVAQLARRQERELRAWLAGERPAHPEETLLAALRAAASETEDALGAVVEVIAVGDCPLDERAWASVAAAREAMVNAAKFAGGAAISVYAEVGDDRLQLFVRDRGPGFDPAAVPAERRGIRDSLVGRMKRAGGSATVRSTPGGGTEVEISIPRRTTDER